MDSVGNLSVSHASISYPNIIIHMHGLHSTQSSLYLETMAIKSIRNLFRVDGPDGSRKRCILKPGGFSTGYRFKI